MKTIFNKKAAYILGSITAGAACIMLMPLNPNVSIIVLGGLSSYLLAQALVLIHKDIKSTKKPAPTNS